MRRIIVMFAVAVAGFVVVPQVAVGAFIERVSVATDGTQGNGDSEDPAISADGRYVAFESDASNLVPGDTIAAATCSCATCGRAPPGGSAWPATAPRPTATAIPGDQRRRALRGLRVVRVEPGPRLHEPQQGGMPDVFVRDLRSGTTRRVSVAGDGTQANAAAMSRRSAPTGATWPSSRARRTWCPATRTRHDVFVRDLRSGTTRRVDVASDGTQGNARAATPAISADGRYVAFARSRRTWCPATRTAGRPTCSCATCGRAPPGGSAWPVTAPRPTTSSDSGDQRRRALRGLRSARRTCARRYEHRRVRARPAVGHHPAGQRGHRRHPGPTTAASDPAISADGRYVTFDSDASNLVPGDTNNNCTAATCDVFVRDLRSGTTRRVSVAADGTQANNSASPGDQRRRALRGLRVGARRTLCPATRTEHSDVFVRDLNGTPTAAEQQVHGLEDQDRGGWHDHVLGPGVGPGER